VQTIVDSCVRAAELREQIAAREIEMQRSRERVIGRLMNLSLPVAEWRAYADQIDELATQQRCVERYKTLIGDLNRGRAGEQCQLRAVNTLLEKNHVRITA